MELRGKTVVFLGSSVTYGSAANGISFADLMAQQCEFRMVKEAVSGTTLADVEEASYVARLKTLDPGIKADLFICQLSTNDASRGIALEQVEAAIRWICGYVKKIWNCPVVFYTGTRYDSAAYGAMVQRLLELREVLGIHVLDLWNDPQMLAVEETAYMRYMADPIHPTRMGYEEWWTPRFVSFCQAL